MAYLLDTAPQYRFLRDSEAGDCPGFYFPQVPEHSKAYEPMNDKFFEADRVGVKVVFIRVGEPIPANAESQVIYPMFGTLVVIPVFVVGKANSGEQQRRNDVQESE